MSKPRQMVRYRAGLGAFAMLSALLCIASTRPAAAFQLVPIQATFRASGPESVQTFRLENPGEEPVAIEISIARRAMNLDGTDALTPDEENFVVVPTQVVLRPKQVQAVRVQWVGAGAVDEEASYRLIAEQVPVDVEGQAKEGGRLRMLVRYVASLYVAPVGAKGEIVVESVQRRSGEGEAPQLELVLHNRGTGHLVLREPRLTLRAGSSPPVALAPAALAGQNLIAGARRRFLVDAPSGLEDGALAAELVVP